MIQRAIARRIWVKFTSVGFHYFEDALRSRSYLSHSHRHVFHITVSMAVDHSLGEVEFHQLRDDALTSFRGLAPDGQGRYGPQTCETLAQRLATILADRYARTVTAEVSEDGECGGVVEVSPEVET